MDPEQLIIEQQEATSQMTKKTKKDKKDKKGKKDKKNKKDKKEKKEGKDQTEGKGDKKEKKEKKEKEKKDGKSVKSKEKSKKSDKKEQNVQQEEQIVQEGSEQIMIQDDQQVTNQQYEQEYQQGGEAEVQQEQYLDEGLEDDGQVLPPDLQHIKDVCSLDLVDLLHGALLEIVQKNGPLDVKLVLQNPEETPEVFESFVALRQQGLCGTDLETTPEVQFTNKKMIRDSGWSQPTGEDVPLAKFADESPQKMGDQVIANLGEQEISEHPTQSQLPMKKSQHVEYRKTKFVELIVVGDTSADPKKPYFRQLVEKERKEFPLGRRRRHSASHQRNQGIDTSRSTSIPANKNKMFHSVYARPNDNMLHSQISGSKTNNSGLYFQSQNTQLPGGQTLTGSRGNVTIRHAGMGGRDSTVVSTSQNFGDTQTSAFYQTLPNFNGQQNQASRVEYGRNVPSTDYKVRTLSNSQFTAQRQTVDAVMRPGQSSQYHPLQQQSQQQFQRGVPQQLQQNNHQFTNQTQPQLSFGPGGRHSHPTIMTHSYSVPQQQVGGGPQGQYPPYQPIQGAGQVQTARFTQAPYQGQPQQQAHLQNAVPLNPLQAGLGAREGAPNGEERQYLIIDEYQRLPEQVQNQIAGIAQQHNGDQRVHVHESADPKAVIVEDIMSKIEGERSQQNSTVQQGGPDFGKSLV